VVAPSVPLTHLRLVERDRYTFVAELPREAAALLELPDLPDADVVRLRVDHVGRRKMPYPKHRSLDYNAGYCQVMMNRMRDIVPSWTVLPAVHHAA
jgi:putative methyltransferase